MTRSPDTTRDVAAICAAATAHNYGQTVYGTTVDPAGTVRVQMSSWPRAREARDELMRRGYDAEIVDDCAVLTAARTRASVQPQWSVEAVVSLA
jgi:hypothetical protein